MLSNLERIKSQKSEIKHVPEEAGVYIWWHGDTPIYIGKAINLRRRLDSYFAAKLIKKTADMVAESDSISMIKVQTEIEALLLEADLVWKHQPKYNSALKDDKHPLYIMITKEEYPRVIPVRRAELGEAHRKIFGPFPATHIMRRVLKMLRPIFHYGNHAPSKRVCLYHQMGLCDPCPSQIANETDPVLKELLKYKYMQNVKNVTGVLSGRIKNVRNELEHLMHEESKKQNYELAEEAKRQIARLDYITTPSTDVGRFVENPNLLEDIRQEELVKLEEFLQPYMDIKNISVIECYDIAHLAGTSPTASQVTFVDGDADKSLYRHYRIRQVKGNDDISSLREVASRREKRASEWELPDLIIVDGGKTQTKVFYEIFHKHGVPVVGLAKRFETIVIPNGKEFTLIRPRGKALNLVTRIRDEAHRFARSYHHKLVKRALITR